VINSKRTRWADHVAGVREKVHISRLLVVKPDEEKKNTWNTHITERIILKWILRKYDATA
jgi:hypothetical protein